jgi:hypothetical protein
LKKESLKESIGLKDVYAIKERESTGGEAKDHWTRIGIGFVNRDNSINVVLDAIPLNGRFHIRDRQTSQKQAPQRSGGAEVKTWKRTEYKGEAHV